MAALRAALDRITPITDEAWSAIAALTRRRPVAAHEAVLRAGDRATNIFYIERGLLREYYLDRRGVETTRRFCTDGDFTGSLGDLLSQRPAAVSIQALTASEVITLEWAAVDTLAERHPSIMKLLRRFAEGLYLRKMQREFEMLTLPAEERYRRFAREEKRLLDRLPRHLIASYLGITPVHLSRISAAARRTQSRTGRTRKTKTA